MATEGDVIKQIEKFAGTWKQIRCDNIDAFFKEMGLNYLLRKIASQANPEVEILINGVDIQISFKTPFRAECMKYKLNEEVEIETQKGKFKATTTYESGKLISKQVPIQGNDAKPMVSEREINVAGELVTTIYVGDVVCVRIFTKL
uniref:Uncharacterized protein n=1 Tax=Arion vulgaris TaxID=1028688 RepID=A0A0B6ZK26_9EUPU